jgi:DNA-binding LacI/PurR family transcriptional regulator
VLLDGAGWPRLATSLAGMLATITFADAPPDGDAAVTRDAVRRLLDAPVRPTAIVCPGDIQALIALRECALREIQIPEELSVVGFGDEPFARYSHPALSTIRVAMSELGGRSGDALADMLTGRSPERYTAGLKVIVRETTGPGPG